MCKLTIILLFLLACTYTLAATYEKTKGCPTLRLSNGRVRYRQRNRLARFSCNSGYELVGEKYTLCLRNSKWDNPLPICVRPTCSVVNATSNILMFTSHMGAVLNFYCKPGYTLRGAQKSYCDGQKWSSYIPTCVVSGREPPTSCDFEKDLCDWSQDVNHDFDWRRQNLRTPSGHIGTGPSFDHTKGPNQDGYYAYIESSSRLENDTARLISPVYSKMEDGFCFIFFYHMFGQSIGSLNVYVKKENDPSNTKRLSKLFSKSGNQGDKWYKGIVMLPSMDKNFQIIIEGVRGSSYISDIAIDDVGLWQNCSVEEETTTDFMWTDFYSTDTTETPIVYESCFGRCDMDVATNNYTCECVEGCFENNTCCPDYAIICLVEPTDYITDSTTDTDDFTEVELQTYALTVNHSTILPEVKKETTATIFSSTETPKIMEKIPKPSVNITKINTTTKPSPSETDKRVPPTKMPEQKTTKARTVTKLVMKSTLRTTTTTVPYLPKKNNTPSKKPVVIVNPSNLIPKVQNKTKTSPSINKQPSKDNAVVKNPSGVPNGTKYPAKPLKPPKVPSKPKPVSTTTRTTTTTTTTTPKTTSTPSTTTKTTTPPTTISFLDLTQGTLEMETDVLATVKTEIIPLNDRPVASLASRSKESDDSNQKLIIGVVGALVFIMLAVLCVVFVVRRYHLRMFGRFRGYKGTHTSDSFSDVRFLASDEALDFTLRSADGS